MPSKRKRNLRPSAPPRSGEGRRERVERSEATKPLPRWQWRTFPVFFALVSGLLLASLVNGVPDNTAGAAVQLIAIAGFGYGLAHLVVMNVIVAGRVRRRSESLARGETPDDDWEDETTYADETTAP